MPIPSGPTPDSTGQPLVPSEGALPSFSVVIPTYNRPACLRQCLEAVADLEYPRRLYEVIVVDDGGDLPLKEVVGSTIQGLDVTLLRQTNRGPAAARNLGCSRAGGRFIAFTDDDCRPDPNWLRALAEQFAKTPDDMLGGRVVNALAGNPYATASQHLLSYLYGYYEDRRDGCRFFTSNNLSVPAKRFRNIGGFDAAYLRAAGEDRELCDRWQWLELGMTYAPRAVVYHAHDLNLASYLHQHIRYGMGALDFHECRARRRPIALRAEPPSFYVGLLRHPLRQAEGLSGIGQMVLIGLSQVANAAGFFYAKLSRDRRSTRAPADRIRAER